MVWVEGLRLGSTARRAWLQSTYSVLSWVSQYSRSSASLAKAGTGLSFLLIDGSLLAVHVPGGNDPDHGPAFPQGEGEVQPAPGVGLAQGVNSGLVLAVLHVFHQQQGLIEEHLFGLGLGHAVLVSALAGVAGIPLEADDGSEFDHLCILSKYTVGFNSAAPGWGRQG